MAESAQRDQLGPGGTIDIETAARQGACEVLTGSWREADGFCPPNPAAYPHQWLWDSCFHAIAWAALDDARALRELESCLSGALASGFVPHMRYLGPSSGRGPLAGTSSFTQPPIYAHAARYLHDRGLHVDPAPIEAGLHWLWDSRLTGDGLVFIVHPWESGSDDSPRWDSWVGLPEYDHAAFSAWDRDLVAATDFDSFGAAVWSSAFVAAPAAFNAFVAHAAAETYLLTRDPLWERRSKELAAAIDEHLWDEASGLWVDRAIVGGGGSVSVPTLDGVLGALCTDDADKAQRALAHLSDPDMFGAPHGLAFVPPSHDSYDPDEYWRGSAWPQLSYMCGVAARRWGDEGLYRDIARKSVRAALESGFSEHWNPETGGGLGAVPQGWAALAATYASEVSTERSRGPMT
jgi:hypothetical protein